MLIGFYRRPLWVIVHSINGVSALAAVILVVAYVIARPHIGTVWYFALDPLQAMPSPFATPPAGLTSVPPDARICSRLDADAAPDALY